MSEEVHKTPNNYIVNGAADLLEKAAATIRQRSECYNSDDISYEDYMIMGIESAVQQVLECLVRFSNSQSPDKAIDAVAYMALLMQLIEAGVPQSRFSPLFRRFVPEIYKGMHAAAHRERDNAI